MSNPVTPPAPPRKVICDIIGRYIKEDKTPNWRVDIPVFIKDLWPKYPSIDFWTKHEMPYRLNTMLHFKTKEGAARLESDYLIFNYTPALESGLDCDAQPSYSDSNIDEQPIPPPPVLIKRPVTIAQFIKQQPNQPPNHA